MKQIMPFLILASLSFACSLSSKKSRSISSERLESSIESEESARDCWEALVRRMYEVSTNALENGDIDELVNTYFTKGSSKGAGKLSLRVASPSQYFSFTDTFTKLAYEKNLIARGEDSKETAENVEEYYRLLWSKDSISQLPLTCNRRILIKRRVGFWEARLQRYYLVDGEWLSFDEK